LQGADLRLAQMEAARFFHAHLAWADLSSARMEGADFFGAQMEGVNLSHAKMEGANLARAKLGNANLKRAQMEGTKLTLAHLKGADLFRTQMKDADLTAAKMQGANLRGVHMQAVSWGGADLAGVVAQSTNMLNAKNLTQDQLDQIVGNAQTLLPVARAGHGAFRIATCWDVEPNKSDETIVNPDIRTFFNEPVICNANNPKQIFEGPAERR